MGKREYVIVVLIAGAGGLVGGMLVGRGETSGTAWAQKEMPVLELISARQFRVVDEQGRARATLLAKQGGPAGVAIYGDEGDVRVMLSSDDKGEAVLAFYDGKLPQPRISLSMRKAEPTLTLCDDRGQNLATLCMLGERPTLMLGGLATGDNVILARDRLLFSRDHKAVWQAPEGF